MDPRQASSEGAEVLCGWHAVYNDGTVLSQYGDQECSSEAIDRKKLRAFTLTTKDGSKTIITQCLKPGQKLIYRVRNVPRPGLGRIERMHIIGWEHGESRHVTFVHESDMSITMGDYVENDPNMPWYYPIDKLPHDDIAVE